MEVHDLISIDRKFCVISSVHDFRYRILPQSCNVIFFFECPFMKGLYVNYAYASEIVFLDHFLSGVV